MFQAQNRETIISTWNVSVAFKIIMTMSVTRTCFTTQHQTCKTKTRTTVCKTKTDFLVSDRSCPKTDCLRPHHWPIRRWHAALPRHECRQHSCLFLQLVLPTSDSGTCRTACSSTQTCQEEARIVGTANQLCVIHHLYHQYPSPVWIFRWLRTWMCWCCPRSAHDQWWALVN